MAPIAPWLNLLLAAGLVADASAKPLFPGRHAPPSVANLLSSHVKKDLHSRLAEKYAGEDRGLTRPPKMSEHQRRAASIPAGWTYTGCVDESWGQRLLQGMGFSSGSMTTSLCLSTCQASGFTYAGTEFSDECYCGNAEVGSGGQVGSETACQMPCQGDSSSICGGNWMLSLYQFNSTTVSTCAPATGSTGAMVSGASSGTVPTPTSSGATTTATTPPTHTDATDSSEWYSLGCAQDYQNDRILYGYSELYINQMTPDFCLSLCEDKGFAFAGVEYGSECYCGNTVPSTITYSDGQCTMQCAGDASETCGGFYFMELFELISGSSNCPATSIANATAAITTGPAASVTATTTSVSNSLIGNVNFAVHPESTASNTDANSQQSVSATATGIASALPTLGVPASSSTHNVWAHFMVGNTYPYNVNDWTTDMADAQSANIDGFALNMGSDSWQPDRINDAYTAAQNAGNNFKLFLSLDMTVLSCQSTYDAQNLVNLVARWANHPNQAVHDGKVLVSTFAGSDCTFGQGSSNAWENLFVQPLLNAGVAIFFMPSIFSDPSTFSSNNWMDGELNWNSGWPMGDYDVSTASDLQYMAALGSKEYMPAVSPFFYTHFGANSWNKNWLYRGDDWLYCTRWEQIIAMRNTVVMTEILTWNDFGESSYIGPIQQDSALPAGSNVWVDGFDHTGLLPLTKYYATAFKTGSYPPVTTDSIFMWTRPHPADATASNDPVGRPTGWNWTNDFVWAVVLAQGPATVTLTSGGSSTSFPVVAGLNKLQIPSQPGGISGQLVRNGNTVVSYTSNGFSYTNNPVTYNYNYFVGSSSSS